MIVGLLWSPVTPQVRESVIVQATDMATAAALVRAVGGEVTHELGIIDAVGAKVTRAQLASIEAQPYVRTYANREVQVAAGPSTYFPTLVEANRLHGQNILGTGVTIAILDTGHWTSAAGLSKTPSNQNKLLAGYDAIRNRMVSPSDASGHGTHITGIAMSSNLASDGTYQGVAPGANLVSIAAFGANGGGTYFDVIRGIAWAVVNKNTYNIRVLNCSFSAPPQSYYWDDPLNQAIMRAWQAGIVVVAAAGNTGPEPMTIGVPGNVPYVITVGAMSDNNTPADRSDDFLSSFSSTGPTVEGFVKPEVVAPGGHIVNVMHSNTDVANTYPEFQITNFYFKMSGTSQATAVTSGIVALMLQANPNLTPDDVKCRLLSSARTAMKADGSPAYSIFQQGAGMVNAYDAVYSSATGCANQNMDIAADLAGTVHYGGRANQDPVTGEYYLMGLDGYVWGGTYVWSEGYVWGESYVWGDGYVWGNSYVWGDAYIWGESYVWGNGYVWSGSYVWGDSYVWGGSYVWGNATMAVNKWVFDDPYRAPATGVSTMHVANLAGSSTVVNARRGDWQANVTVTVRDNGGLPVKDADVTGVWGATSYWCRTDISGQCTISSATLSKNVSSVTFTVRDMMHTFRAYNASANSMTSIQVSRP